MLFFIVICFIPLVFSADDSPIRRTMSDGVHSLGYKVIYADADMAVINEVVTDLESAEVLHDKNKWKNVIKPLAAEDVKCLMSVNKYCSKEMGIIKSTLIHAIKDDCSKCSVDEKETAGRVIAAMMAHDPVAWKLFLTRSALEFVPEKKLGRQKLVSTLRRYKALGKPEEIIKSKDRYIVPGFKVRVKRYVVEEVP